MKSWQDIGNTDTFQIQWFQSGTKCGFIRTRIRSHENGYPTETLYFLDPNCNYRNPGEWTFNFKVTKEKFYNWIDQEKQLEAAFNKDTDLLVSNL